MDPDLSGGISRGPCLMSYKVFPLWWAGHRLFPPTCKPGNAWALALQSSSQTPQSSVHMKISVHLAPRVAPSIGFQNFLWTSFVAVAAAAPSGSCLTGSSHLAFPGLSSSPQDLRLEHPILQLWTAPRALRGSYTIGSCLSSTSPVCFPLSIKTLYFAFVRFFYCMVGRANPCSSSGAEGKSTIHWEHFSAEKEASWRSYRIRDSFIHGGK